MTDDLILTRDQRLAAATTPLERAEILGLDYPRVMRASRIGLLSAAGLFIGASILIVPVLGAILVFSGRAVAAPPGSAALWPPLVAMAPLALSILVGQVVLRAGRRWRTVTQQATALTLQALAEGLGFGLAAILLANEPGAIIALLMAGCARGPYRLAAASTLGWSLRRSSPRLAFAVDQVRTLPVNTSTAGGRVAPLIWWAVVNLLEGLLLVSLLWLHPEYMALAAFSLVAVELGAARLSWIGRSGLALGLTWAFNGVLALAVILNF